MKNILISVILGFIFLIILVECKTKNGEKTDEIGMTNENIEAYRPQFHFTPDSMWMNDPNGMVYYEGEYHLFYQYYPDSTVWGPMHWGHAVSADLVHWEHLPIALYPDSLGYIFSGSAVIDWNNTSGFGNGENPPMVAIYTYHDPIGALKGKIDYQTQGIAFSLDKGRSWTKYEGNPVLNNPGIIDFRDPKVMWYEPDRKWIMTLAVKDHISFYSSKDLRSWQHESDFSSEIGAYGGVWECPDLFSLKSSKNDTEKWVLLVSINPGAPNGGSGTQYFVGSFDGKKFTNENEKLYWIDYGKDNYAGVTWSDVPVSDGRRLFIGWMSNWEYGQVVPTKRWRSAMTIPRELTLETIGTNNVLISKPIEELSKLRGKIKEFESMNISGFVKLQTVFDISCSEFEFEFRLNKDSLFGIPSEFGIVLSNELNETFIISIDPINSICSFDRSKSGNISFAPTFDDLQTMEIESDSSYKLHIYLDKSSVELFINNGRYCMTSLVFPTKDFTSISLFSNEGSVNVVNGKIYKLSSKKN